MLIRYGLVALLLAAPPARAQPTLVVEIRGPKGPVLVGDEVPITFVVRNAGADDYRYTERSYDRSGRIPEFALRASDAAGVSLPDPRAKRLGGIGGGLGSLRSIAPEQSFDKVVALNRWVLLTQPGRYRVTGTYVPERTPTITTPPIEIEVAPRTDAQLAKYVATLSEQLRAETDEPKRVGLVKKLMYTCDRRALPALIEVAYGNDATQYWSNEAFQYYLPADERIDAALTAAAKSRGLASGMMWALQTRGFTAEQFYPLIEKSLAADRRATWDAGARAAQAYPDPRFTPRLIAIVTDPAAPGRAPATMALAALGTDEAHKMLEKLTQDPDRSVRNAAKTALARRHKR